MRKETVCQTFERVSGCEVGKSDLLGKEWPQKMICLEEACGEEVQREKNTVRTQEGAPHRKSSLEFFNGFP